MTGCRHARRNRMTYPGLAQWAVSLFLMPLTWAALFLPHREL